MRLPLSILDLAPVAAGQTCADSLAGCVTLARRAESLGFRRVWYAEHHNIPGIASSAPAVIVAHVAAHTATIRLGAGGVMLPNHTPLTIAEQFGTLACLHPGRIDLGLGRAPGTDPATFRALRRDRSAADAFPEDVLELQGYLGEQSRVSGVEATPGRGTHVPLYILGSSLFGAGLAAELGLPYAFASHFAPAALSPAVALYRRQFRPSPQAERPHVIAGLNVLAAQTTSEAREQAVVAERAIARALLGRGRQLDDATVDALLDSPGGRFVREMGTYSAIGTPAEVADYVERFRRHADADELMISLRSPSLESRLRSAELLAEAMS